MSCVPQCAHIHMHTHLCMCVHLHAHMHTYVQTYMHKHICTYANTHAHICAQLVESGAWIFSLQGVRQCTLTLLVTAGGCLLCWASSEGGNAGGILLEAMNPGVSVVLWEISLWGPLERCCTWLLSCVVTSCLCMSWVYTVSAFCRLYFRGNAVC